ncbi:hypothetical protein [Shimazuella kribbensis]|uniref:hypothetical protein n=1 Tax=Shimazuella kribbensis TaxID=139808 RepID=UPI00048A4619|nr:hypothetical protein [Shimazuella kribbensis]
MGIDYEGIAKLLKSSKPSGTRQNLRSFRNTDFYFKFNKDTKTVHILDACGGTKCATVTNTIEDVQDQICKDSGIKLPEWRWVFYSPDGFVTEFLRDSTRFGSFGRDRIKDADFTVDLEYYRVMKEIQKFTDY